jgi:hypothetical protein
MKKLVVFTGVLIIAIAGCKKDETVINTVFDPSYPDGTENLITVHVNFSADDSFTVPDGRNFHGYIEGANSPAYITINGQTVTGYQWNRIILTAGDVVHSSEPTPDRIFISGYTSPQNTQVVYIDIADGNSYTVPADKRFYLTWVNAIPWNNGAETIYVDGVAIKWSWLTMERANNHILVDGGSTLSTDAPGQTKVFLNGFLK